MTFRPSYALAALAVFAIEVIIALFVHDGLVRPFVGDSLAIVLVYPDQRPRKPSIEDPADPHQGPARIADGELVGAPGFAVR
jgi:hypothetical protein